MSNEREVQWLRKAQRSDYGPPVCHSEFEQRLVQMFVPDESLSGEHIHSGQRLIFTLCDEIHIFHSARIYYVEVNSGDHVNYYARFIRRSGDYLILEAANADFESLYLHKRQVRVTGILSRVCLANRCDGNSCYEWNLRHLLRWRVDEPPHTMEDKAARRRTFQLYTNIVASQVQDKG